MLEVAPHISICFCVNLNVYSSYCIFTSVRLREMLALEWVSTPRQLGQWVQPVDSGRSSCQEPWPQSLSISRHLQSSSWGSTYLKKRLIKETIFIQKLEPSLNIQAETKKLVLFNVWASTAVVVQCTQCVLYFILVVVVPLPAPLVPWLIFAVEFTDKIRIVFSNSRWVTPL